MMISQIVAGPRRYYSTCEHEMTTCKYKHDSTVFIKKFKNLIILADKRSVCEQLNKFEVPHPLKRICSKK